MYVYIIFMYFIEGVKIFVIFNYWCAVLMFSFRCLIHVMFSFFWQPYYNFSVKYCKVIYSESELVEWPLLLLAVRVRQSITTNFEFIMFKNIEW